jgi:hypothetical protein
VEFFVQDGVAQVEDDGFQHGEDNSRMVSKGRALKVAERFDALVLFLCSLRILCITVGVEGNVNDVIDICFRHVVRAEALDDVHDVIAAGPESMAARVGLYDERSCRLLNLSTVFVANADRPFLILRSFDLF